MMITWMTSNTSQFIPSYELWSNFRLLQFP